MYYLSLLTIFVNQVARLRQAVACIQTTPLLLKGLAHLEHYFCESNRRESLLHRLIQAKSFVLLRRHAGTVAATSNIQRSYEQHALLLENMFYVASKTR